MKKFALLAAFGLLWMGCKSGEDTSAATTTTGGGAASSDGKTATASWAGVQEIFNSKCILCHGENGKEGLDLRSYATAMKGAEDGAVIKPGDPAGSKIVQLIKADPEHRMPKNQPPLEESQIKLIEDWIASGAKES